MYENECGTGFSDGEVAVNDVIVRSRVIQGKIPSLPPRSWTHLASQNALAFM
jgi:hypothetical protein